MSQTPGQYGWMPDVGTIDTSAVVIRAKFETCCEALLKAAIHRDEPGNALTLPIDFPEINGSVKDWMKILSDVPHYNKMLNNLVSQLKAHANKRFETKIKLEQCRKQQHLIIALCAEMFIKATHKNLSERSFTDAHKDGIERQNQKKRDAQNLIKEVPHGQNYKPPEEKIKSYVAQEIKSGTEITDTDGT